MSESNWFLEQTGNVLDRFDLYLNGDYRPWVDEQPADNFHLVHTVSGDNAQGAGFARVLNDRYHFRDSLCADLAESFPGFGTTGWTFDKRFGDFFRIPLLRDSNGEYYAGKMQRMRFEANVGHIYATDRCPHILGLVTKEHYYDKPSLNDMRAAIWNLRAMLETNAWLDGENPLMTEIMMPHIGCGLDKLKWEDVKEIIFDELGDLGNSGKLRVVAFDLPKRPIIF